MSDRKPFADADPVAPFQGSGDESSIALDLEEMMKDSPDTSVSYDLEGRPLSRAARLARDPAKR